MTYYESRGLNMNDWWAPEEKVAPERPGARLSRRRLFLADALLLLVAFFLSNLIKRGGLLLPEGYAGLLFLFFGCWLAASLVGKKFSPGEFRTGRAGFRTLVKSGLYLTYCISFAIVFLGLTTYSRAQVYAACLLFVVLDLGVWAAAHRFLPRGPVRDDATAAEASEQSVNPSAVSYRLVAADLILLIFSFFLVNVLKRGHLHLPPGYDQLLLLLIALWFVPAALTRKYHVQTLKNVYDCLWQWLKSGLLMLAGVSALVYGLRLFHYSRFQSLGTVALLMLMECLLILFLFGGRKRAARAKDVESFGEVARVLDQEPFDLNVDVEGIRRQLLSPARGKMERVFKPAASGVYDFISAHVDLDDVCCYETTVGRSFAPVDRRMETTPARLFVNLHKINDIRRLNEYFLTIHRTLLPGGCFIGYAHTIRTHHQWVYGKFPRQLAHLYYGIDFLLHRVVPKLPHINKLYFMITKGRNRVISRAEMLGRLSFCGFDIVAEKEINKQLWVIARKVKNASFQKNPTYGPLVTLNRAGCNGEIVKVYKLRTMHPYSEFLQQYIFDRNGLQEGGKLKDDFRLTAWGKVFRKLWIDELPMLYNWLKGDLKIVGVRPLSRHYLSLYDEELRRLRQRTKPGLLPPFYADLPATFEEIRASERRYLNAYLESPIRTDLRYFFRSLYNILIKAARSR